uniref:Interleukin 9 n=1 Tax=Periophthalmus magnuspinnatus TaxID=409849 RepID=A0A3B4A041_9GOBI
MRLLLLSVLTVYCCASVNDTGIEKRHRLEEALSYIEVVKNNLPDCCCLTALKCFQANLDLHFNGTCVKKLSRSLKSRTTVSQPLSMDFCNSNNSTQSTCQDLCHMHPKKTAKEFLQRLESLIQMILNSMNKIVSPDTV